MGKLIFPWVLLIVAIIVRLILAAPTTSDDTEVNSLRDEDPEPNISYSIFDTVGNYGCRKKCYVRDHRNRCRLNFSCWMKG